MADFIKPRVLKGFRDFLPAAEIERSLLTEKITASFRSFGFVPIDTPALEYSEILLGKGGGETEKQVYRFTDHGSRDVALRFDLTVPFARYMAEHRSELVLPFKRYHIAKVWRGENTQRGRYREFTQCDFDIVGSESAASDFEILLMMHDTLKAIGAGDICIKLNHRGIFNRFLKRLEIEDQSVAILRLVDKLGKIGKEETGRLLSEIVGDAKAARILDYIIPGNSFEDSLEAITKAAGGPAEDTERLKCLRRFMLDAGIADTFVLDPSITRGLDYYTGIVYESFLNAIPEIGSVCSGGRYDNLAGLYSKEKLSGIGASIGLDRLIAALELIDKSEKRSSFAELFIACTDEGFTGKAQLLAGRFREQGIPCEVFTETKKLGQQFAMAEKKGAKWVIIAESQDENSLTLRNLANRENTEKLSASDILALIR